ncbi:MAG: glycosyltransferase [Pigmentiphaga sp.]|nr:glycosyltransferase [Pigmentiphaga sp.]
MKIVQLYDHFQERGGVERVITMLANGWRDRGHEVALVVRHGKVREVYPLDAGIRRHSLRSLSPRGRLARLLRYLGDLPRLRRLRALREADVVIANGPWCALLMLLAWRLPGLRRRSPAIVLCDHNSPDAFGAITRWLGRRLYGWADGIVALTAQQAGQYRPYASRVEVLPNPVEIPPAGQLAQVAQSRILLAAGRLTPQKGYDLLLQAWRQASPQLPEYHLRIIGDGPERAALAALATQLQLDDRVSFVAATDDLASHYTAAAAFILSSRHEGLPLVLLEALAHGLPVIAFDCDYGPRQVIQPGRNGLLCEPGNPAALAAGLLDTLRNPSVLLAMAAAARCSAEAYALPGILDRWEHLLVEVAASRRLSRK